MDSDQHPHRNHNHNHSRHVPYEYALPQSSGKPKKKKKDRQDDSHGASSGRMNNRSESPSGPSMATQSQQQQQKLLPIKISLRLPGYHPPPSQQQQQQQQLSSSTSHSQYQRHQHEQQPHRSAERDDSSDRRPKKKKTRELYSSDDQENEQRQQHRHRLHQEERATLVDSEDDREYERSSKKKRRKHHSSDQESSVSRHRRSSHHGRDGDERMRDESDEEEANVENRSSAHKRKKKKHKRSSSSRRHHSHPRHREDSEEPRSSSRPDPSTRVVSTPRITLRLGHSQLQQQQQQPRQQPQQYEQQHLYQQPQHHQQYSQQSHLPTEHSVMSGKTLPSSQPQHEASFSPAQSSSSGSKHQKSRSQSYSSQAQIKQESHHPSPITDESRPQMGQKKPFSSFNRPPAVITDSDSDDQSNDEDEDDPLAGDLDDPEDVNDDDDDDDEDEDDDDDDDVDDDEEDDEVEEEEVDDEGEQEDDEEVEPTDDDDAEDDARHSTPVPGQLGQKTIASRSAKPSSTLKGSETSSQIFPDELEASQTSSAAPSAPPQKRKYVKTGLNSKKRKEALAAAAAAAATGIVLLATAPTTTTSATKTKGGRKGKAARPFSPRASSTPRRKDLASVCHKLLDQFKRRDSYGLFTDPVDRAIVPDYATIIKNPMDFSTMESKVTKNFYPTMNEFLQDFQLVCDNARLYNAKDTVYWKQADKLWDWGSRAIERERKLVQESIDEATSALANQANHSNLVGIKDEEAMDVDIMGDYASTATPGVSTPASTLSATAVAPTSLRAGGSSMMSFDGNIESPGDTSQMAYNTRVQTPRQYRKTKKIKWRRDGVIVLSYDTDGSIDPNSHPDAWSLVPLGSEYGSAPMLSIIGSVGDQQPGVGASGAGAATTASGSSSALANASTTTPSSSSTNPVPVYLDDYPYSRPTQAQYREAQFSDYGPFPLLEPQSESKSGVQNIPAYTGLLFGDETGEAYVRSLVMFLDGIVEREESSEVNNKREQDSLASSAMMDMAKAFINEKVEKLTLGASVIADKVAMVVKDEIRGESPGDSLGVYAKDTRVPMDVWLKIGDEKVLEEVEERQSFSVVDDVEKKGQLQQQQPSATSHVVASQVDKAKTVIKTEDVTLTGDKPAVKEGDDMDERMSEAVKDEMAVEEGNSDSTNPKAPEMMDIRTVIQAIAAWPLVMRERKDYEDWQHLKIELESLLPKPSVAFAAAIAAAPALAVIPATSTTTTLETEGKGKKVKDEHSSTATTTISGSDIPWAEGTDDGQKKWIREYLEQNSLEMKTLMELLAAATKTAKSKPSATLTATPEVVASSTDTSTTTTLTNTEATESGESPATQVSRLLESIRIRLMAMAKNAISHAVQ